MKKFFSAMFALVLFGTCMPASVHAAYPERPITMIVPFGAGGATDIVARFIGDHLSRRLGKTVIIKNIVGTSGILGTSNLADSKPDGYTIGLVPIAPLVMQPVFRETSYSLQDFCSIARVTNDPLYLEVSANSPIRNLADMEKAVREAPGRYYYGHLGQGSQIHLALAHLYKVMNLDLKSVVFKGDADAMQAMAADRMHFYVSLPSILGRYDIRPVAVLSENRDPNQPDVPTAREQGVDVVYTQWMALVGPKGIPSDIVRLLSDTFAEICNDPEYIKELASLNTSPAFLPAEENQKFMEAEQEHYRKVMPEIYGK